jgi:hypothetical protein
MNLLDQRFLVTGATGFVGASLVRHSSMLEVRPNTSPNSTPCARIHRGLRMISEL